MQRIGQNSPSTRKSSPPRQRPPRKPTRERGGSQVRPGPRRALAHLIGTGRLFSFFLFLGTMALLFSLFTSQNFAVREVRVEGNNALTTDSVSELSGLQGTSIWFVDPDMVAERLLQNAYVEQVAVSVSMPHRATIHIVERIPEMRWQLGGMHYLVDSNGRVLDVAQGVPVSDTLVIIDTTPHTLQPNDRVDPDALKLARALALRLPNELNFAPASIGWDFGLGIFVTSGSGQTIVFGQSDNLDHKLAVLRYLLEDNTAFTYLDLRPSSPFYQNTAAGSP